MMEETESIGSWSDPGVSPGGVIVPELLQVLFSIDFLPYVTPPTHYTASTTTCADDDELSSSSSSSSSECSPQPMSPPSSGRRRRITPRRQISRVVQGLKRRVSTNAHHHRVPPADDSPLQFLVDVKSDTPRRKGRGPASYDSTSLMEHQKMLLVVQEESIRVRKHAAAIERRVSRLRDRAARLQKELEQSMQKIGDENALLEGAKDRLDKLEKAADFAEQYIEEGIAQNSSKQRSFQRLRSMTVQTSQETLMDTPVRPRANTAPIQPSSSSAFMRAFDLDVHNDTESNPQSPSAPLNKALSTKELFYIDHDIPTILDRLFRLGHSVCTDDSPRFQPTRETQRLIQTGNPSEDVMTWIGSVDHRGFGHDWPVVKARGTVKNTPKDVYEFLLDSSQIKRYNKICQGREDVSILQEGIHIAESESVFGFAGDARIHRLLVKPKMLPKTIEVLSLQYSKQLEDGSYMTVSRSLWEDDSGVHVESPSGRIRSEMLLGVQLLRPLKNGHCEMTTITHVFSPGVPEAMAKRFAPISATNLLRDLQAVFK